MKYSHKIIWIIFIIITVLPLIFIDGYFYGMQVPRIIVFWFFVCFALSACLFKQLYTKTITFKITKITALLTLYFLVFLISSIFSISPTLSFYSNFVRMDGFVSFSFLYLFYLIYSNVSFSEKNWFLIAKTSCIVALLVSLIAFPQHDDYPIFRSVGTFSNPLTLCIYLLFHFFLIVSFLANFTIKKSIQSIFQLLMSLIFGISYLVGIIFTQSRAGYLGLTLGIVSGIIYLFILKKTLRKKLMLLSSTLVFLPLFCVQYFSKTSLLKRITNFSMTDSSSSSRLELWKISLQEALEKPFFGWGKENFIYFFVKNYNNHFNDADEWYDRSHNFLIDKLIEHGFIGLFSYLALFFVTLWLLLKKNTLIDFRTKATLFSFLICYFVFHFTSFESFSSHVILACILIFINQHLDYQYFTISKPFYAFASLTILIIGFWAIYTTTNSYLKWNNINKKPVDLETIADYEKLIQTSEIGKYDIVLKYDLIRNQAFVMQNQTFIQNNYFQSAIKNTQNLLLAYPNHPILFSQLGLVQMQSGNLKSAIETYQELQRIAPKRPVNLMDLGMLYLQNKQFDKAIATFDNIYKMDNTYEPALINKAYCFAEKGEYENSRKILNQLSVNAIVNNFEKVTEIYAKLNSQQVLLERMENVKYEERKFFKPNTYLKCLQLAVFLEKNESIRKAIYHCLGYYAIPFDARAVEKMVVKIEKKELPPKVFYDKFKQPRWGEYPALYE